MAAAAEDSVAAAAEVAAMAEAVEVDTAVAEMVGTAAAEVRWLTDTMLKCHFSYCSCGLVCSYVM